MEIKDLNQNTIKITLNNIIKFMNKSGTVDRPNKYQKWQLSPSKTTKEKGHESTIRNEESILSKHKQDRQSTFLPSSNSTNGNGVIYSTQRNTVQVEVFLKVEDTVVYYPVIISLSSLKDVY